VWSQHTGNQGKDLKSFKPESELPAVSGGPFTLVEYRKNEIALFERNPNFYGPEPNIDALGFQYFTNTDAQLTALKNGEIDFITDVPPTAVDSLKGDPNIEIVTGESVEVNDFIINSNPKKPEHRELLDLDVKEALAHAIDKQKIIDVVFAGYGEPAATFIPPATGKWSNPNLEPEEFDLDLANQILDDEGLRRGPDGIRVAGDHRMEYEVITPNSLDWVNRTFSIIQSDFEKIGIELTQKSLDDTAAFEAIGAPNYKYLEFDLALWGWVPLIDPDFMLSTFTCNQYGGWSDSGYCDPAYDRMYQQQGVTLDQTKRKQIVWRMQQKIYRDKPYVMLNNEAIIEARAKGWDGFVLTPQGSFNALSKDTALQVHQTG
jgi:peptide/nickel transport system substrate-binding protein